MKSSGCCQSTKEQKKCTKDDHYCLEIDENVNYICICMLPRMEGRFKIELKKKTLVNSHTFYFFIRAHSFGI